MVSRPVTTFRSRSYWYGLTLGCAAAALCIGLALPFLFGEPGATTKLGTAAGAESGIDFSSGEGEGATAGADPDVTTDVTAGAGSAGAGGSGVSSSSAGAGTGAGSAAAGKTAARATGGKLTVGIPIFDLGFRVPGVDPEEQKAQWNSYVNAVNASGGVNGGQIEAVYAGYNPLDDSSVRAMCNRLVDAKVLAVLAYGLFDTQVLCFTEEHGIPLINGIGFSDEIVSRSRGLLFSAIIGKTRAGRAQVAELDRIGVLKNKKIGILTSTDRNDDSAARHGIQASLEARGYKVTYTANLSSELQTGTAQIPVEVQQMQSRGIDAVFLAANLLYSGTFVQNGENQGFRPQYLTSDLSQMAEDGNTSRMTQAFDGAIGVSVLRTGEDKVNAPEPAFDAQCRATYERTGAKNPRGQLAYNTTMAMCSVVEMFKRGAQAASSPVTAKSLVAGLETLNDFPVAFEAGGSLSPSKHDAPVAVRTLVWKYSCVCYHPSGSFQPAAK